jgi:hypothetical protein
MVQTQLAGSAHGIVRWKADRPLGLEIVGLVGTIGPDIGEDDRFSRLLKSPHLIQRDPLGDGGSGRFSGQCLGRWCGHHRLGCRAGLLPEKYGDACAVQDDGKQDYKAGDGEQALASRRSGKYREQNQQQ